MNLTEEKLFELYGRAKAETEILRMTLVALQNRNKELENKLESLQTSV